MINKKTLSWLTTCPQSDINFKSHLEEANLDTLIAALKDPGISKAARKKIETRAHRLSKEVKYGRSKKKK